MPSAREGIARNLLDTVMFGGLDQVYGGTIVKTYNPKGRSYWSIPICKAKILDGGIDVYSETFIRIYWQTAIRDLPAKGNVIAKSEEEAKRILMQFISQ